MFLIGLLHVDLNKSTYMCYAINDRECDENVGVNTIFNDKKNHTIFENV